MKKSFKSILCLLFALVFVFQFVSAAAPSAFADDGEEEEEPVELSYSVKVGGNNYTGPVSLEALKEGFEIIPSEKAFVNSVSVNGNVVTGYAIAEGRKLVVDADAVATLLAKGRIDKDAGSYSITAEVKELDETLASVTAPAVPELADNEEFVCWVFEYDNNAIVLLDAGESLKPFMNGEFTYPITNEIEVEDPAAEPKAEDPAEEPKAEDSAAEEPKNEEPAAEEPKNEEPAAEEPKNEEPAAEESSEESKSANMMRSKSLGTPQPAAYTITIKPKDDSKLYDGQNAPELNNNAFDIVSAKHNQSGDALTSEQLAKLNITGIKLSYGKESTAWVGDYEIKADVSEAVVEFDGEVVPATIVVTPGKFTVEKITLTITPKDVQKVYDGNVLPGEYDAPALRGGHKISGLKYIKETSAICNTTYVIDPASEIAIKNSKGDDVKGVYTVTISPNSAKYVITKPADKDRIDLSAGALNVSKVYDGTPLSGSLDITKGKDKLPENAQLIPVFVYDGDHTNIGTCKYSLESLKVELDGYDISDAFKFDINATKKILTITGHNYTISVLNAQKEYDGKPLKASDYTVTGLMDGHKIDAIQFKGEQTNAGESESDVVISSIKIVNDNGDDVSGYYNTPEIKKGTLKVNKLAFTITAKSASKVYNGQPLTCNGNGDYTISGSDEDKLDKLDNWSLAVQISGSQTEVGSSDNTIGTVELKVDSKVIEAKNYEVTRKPGKLTVEEDSTKPTVTITVESKSRRYDGTALILDPTAYTISDTLPAHYTLEVTLEKASITAAGSKTVTVEGYKVFKDGELVTDPAKYPFNIALKTGTLTVTKYPITVTADSGTKYYNGKEFVLNSATVTAPNDSLVKGQKATITVEAQDGDGNKVKAIKVGKYYNVVTEVKIKEGNKDVTANYEITTVNGTLTIKNSNGVPTTGDTSNIALWATVLGVSAVAVIAMVVIVLVRKKKSK